MTPRDKLTRMHARALAASLVAEWERGGDIVHMHLPHADHAKVLGWLLPAYSPFHAKTNGSVK